MMAEGLASVPAIVGLQ